MRKSVDLAEQVPNVVKGLKIEKWLRMSTIKSMAISAQFLPNANGEISEAANSLDANARKRFIVLMINAHSRASAQADFWGVIGVPLMIGFLSVIMNFDLSLIEYVCLFSVFIVYMLFYYYHRLLRAAVESILAVLRIPAEYCDKNFFATHDTQSPQ